MTDPNDGRCRLLCDAALAAIAAALGTEFTPRQRQLARHIVAGVEVRMLLKLVGGRGRHRLYDELEVLYAKVGTRRREQFTARVFEEYRHWRDKDQPCLGRNLPDEFRA